MLMESRHIVISGLAITALAAAIALGGWIPDGVIALLFLGAGLGLTYTGALIKRQRQNIANCRLGYELWRTCIEPVLMKN